MASRTARPAAPQRPRLAVRAALLLVLSPMLVTCTALLHAAGEVELKVLDADTGELIAVRMTVQTPRGAALHPRRVPNWADHFLFDGPIVLRLPNGMNKFEIERGLEYRAMRGHFAVDQNVEDAHEIKLQRFVTLKDEGWWSGDLDLQRSPGDLPTILMAEDLHVAVLSQGWMGGAPMAGLPSVGSEPPEDGAGGGMLTMGTERLADLTARYFADHENCLLMYRSGPGAPDGLSGTTAIAAAQEARSAGAHVSVAVPTSWDLPTLVALDLVDSLAVIHRQMHRGGQPRRPLGYPADRVRFPAPRGLGRWSEHIYFQLLNCGLRIPCVAGSGSGTEANAAGEHRTYVAAGEALDYDRWWRALEAGRTFITNGPLLRPTANGQLPGHVFTASAGQTVTLQLALHLSTRSRIDYLEILQDGRGVFNVRLEELAQSNGNLPPIEFERSGWLSVRAVAANDDTYEYAMSGPFYVEIGGQPSISQESAQFFLDWVYERARQLARQHAGDKQALKVALEPHLQAKTFWEKRLAEANQP